MAQTTPEYSPTASADEFTGLERGCASPRVLQSRRFFDRSKAGHNPARQSGAHHFGGLEPLGTLGNFELDFFTLIERTEAISVNCAVMDEDLLAVLHRNEAVTFFGAEPLDNSGRHFPRQPPAKTKQTKPTNRTCRALLLMPAEGGRDDQAGAHIADLYAIFKLLAAELSSLPLLSVPETTKRQDTSLRLSGPLLKRPLPTSGVLRAWPFTLLRRTYLPDGYAMPGRHRLSALPDFQFHLSKPEPYPKIAGGKVSLECITLLGVLLRH
jgi:hypothetical protein